MSKSDDSRHPGRGQLLDWAELREPPHAARRHLERCSGCRAVYQELRALVERMRGDRTVAEPAPHLVARVATWPGPVPQLALEERVAVLEPAAPELAGAGVRRALAPSRLLHYRVGRDFEIDLELRAFGGGFRVSGQVLARPGEEPPVLARLEPVRGVEGPIGDHGEFLLASPTRPEKLVIVGRESRIHLELPEPAGP